MGKKFLTKLMAVGVGTMAPEAISTGLGLLGTGLMFSDIQKLLKDQEIQELLAK